MIADQKTIQERRAICEVCPVRHKRGQIPYTRIILSEHNPIIKLLEFFGVEMPYQCGICSCIIEAKTMFEDSECPKGKW